MCIVMFDLCIVEFVSSMFCSPDWVCSLYLKFVFCVHARVCSDCSVPLVDIILSCAPDTDTGEERYALGLLHLVAAVREQGRQTFNQPVCSL